jgi:hypothetical protein
MFYEYAIEPHAIGSSWETFRYIIEKFGFDKGRLISQFPKHWFREVYGATSDLLPMQKKRIAEALNEAKKNKVIRSARPYDGQAGGWLDHALREHRRLPFRAIISTANPDGDKTVLLPDELEETQPLMNVPHDCEVHRDAASLAAAMRELLCFSSRILFVDPFYDPFNPCYKSTFRECLGIISSHNSDAACEIHYRYHQNKPTNEELERQAADLFPGVIPKGMKVTIFCWGEKVRGEDFHARYLLTERGGISVEAGFSAEGEHQITDMRLMSYDLSQKKLKMFAPEALDYELIRPVIRVSDDGRVERI